MPYPIPAKVISYCANIKASSRSMLSITMCSVPHQELNTIIWTHVTDLRTEHHRKFTHYTFQRVLLVLYKCKKGLGLFKRHCDSNCHPISEQWKLIVFDPHCKTVKKKFIHWKKGLCALHSPGDCADNCFIHKSAQICKVKLFSAKLGGFSPLFEYIP